MTSGWKGSGKGRGGWQWSKLRASILARDRGMCMPCRRAGRVKAATAVDHIRPIAEGGTDEPTNLEAICDRCHDFKTHRRTLPKGCDSRGNPLA